MDSASRIGRSHEYATLMMVTLGGSLHGLKRRYEYHVLVHPLHVLSTVLYTALFTAIPADVMYCKLGTET